MTRATEVLPAGYTAILCGAGPCRGPAGSELAARLHEVVRATRHGVLVVAGCTVGGRACLARDPGAVLVVQPCDPGRRPIGRAVHIGPIRGADVDVVSAWLRDSRDPELLPARLSGLLAQAAGT